MKKKFELIFKVVYFLLTLVSFNVLFARHSYISYISYIVVGLGIIIGFVRLLHVKNYLNAGVFLLVSFVCSYVLGAINTIGLGYADNIKAVVWMSVQYFLIFAFDKKSDFSYEKDILFKVFLGYTWLCSAVSIWMMITKWQRYDLYEGIYWVQGGFIDNRLYGCYTDPNYGAIFAIISILLSVFYLVNKKSIKTIWKTLLVINIVFEFLYLCYSDSRTGLLAVMASSVVLFVVWKAKEKGFLKSLALGLVVGTVIVGLVFAVQKGTSFAKIEIAKVIATKSDASAEEVLLEMDRARVGRVDDQIGGGDDITNNRIAIWGNAIEMFKQNPIIGISYRNIREYALENIPDTYIGFESMHNFFFDILVSQGIVGVLILIALMVWIIWTLVKKYLSLDSYSEFAFLMAVIAAIFASMLTYSEAFYMNTGGAFLFWYILGYLVNFRCEKTKKEDLE